MSGGEQDHQHDPRPEHRHGVADGREAPTRRLENMPTVGLARGDDAQRCRRWSIAMTLRCDHQTGSSGRRAHGDQGGSPDWLKK